MAIQSYPATVAALLLLLRLSSSTGYHVVHSQHQHTQQAPVSYVYYSSHLEDAYPVHERAPLHLAQHQQPPPLAPYYNLYAAQPAPIGHPEGLLEASSEEESGSQQELERDSASGERDRQGYAQSHGYEAAEAKKHDSGSEEAHHEEEAAHAAGHEHEEAEHGAHEEEEAARDAASHSDGSFHRKGERTTGYHKVYHKDEYKKNSEFYDEADAGGQYERYGSGRKEHAAEEGGHAKAGSHESGHENAVQGRRGYGDAGHEELESRSRVAEEAEDAHSREHQDHASRDGHRLAHRHGDHHHGPLYHRLRR
ncbi:hornerin-like [Copidosoma floridanum]|uniref:hornerin-like n=1 Tax=Copidosoma floridanum TaxID=29053 RepID=UPI0006C9C28F|nr:hornerin-like [Copidosoma floridanum]